MGGEKIVDTNYETVYISIMVTLKEAEPMLGIKAGTMRLHIWRKPKLKRLCEMHGGCWFLTDAALDMLKNRPEMGRPSDGK